MFGNSIIKKYICLGGIIISAFILSGCGKKVEIKHTKRFVFSYSVGYYKDASYLYELEKKKDGTYILSYKAAGISDEDKLEKEVSQKIVDDLEQILIQHKIYKWNGFDKSDDNVLDGNGFYLSYFTEDNQQISASGYMKYPDGYSAFKKDIISFYENYFLEKKETTDL